ncbi:septal ring lytic transglycosylase RlpA family protein [Acetobacter oeni]|nr:septal ring lytic transglycosylase RlpA family protein [Acetobacter oeni]MBB3883331.1 rare lipoprotein A [Acetobacter oeni]
MPSQREKKGFGILSCLLMAGLTWSSHASADDGAGSQSSVTHDAPRTTSWAASVRNALARRVADSGTRVQAGLASWYGGRFVHRRTSSGHSFSPVEMTAAHPSAPLGSKLLVHSEETGRSVVVTVNDRGPYKAGRIIDLSHAAASRLGMLNQGVAHVTVRTALPDEVLEVAQAPADSGK